MSKFYQKKKTSQISVGKRQKIGTAFLQPHPYPSAFASKGAGKIWNCYCLIIINKRKNNLHKIRVVFLSLPDIFYLLNYL